MENQVFTTVLVAIGFLTVATFASVGLKKLNFPYTIGLVIIGLIVGWIGWQFEGTELLRNLELSPSIILYLILPCLIFDAAINIDVRLLVKNIIPILLLAAIGLVISALAIGFSLSWLTFLPLGGALLFGALISATDPVAVIALFKDIGAPRRLVTLIDGESVFNDATAIVLFTIIFTAISTAGGQSDTGIVGGIFEFIIVLTGGLLVGGVIGLIGSFVFQLDKSSLVFQKTISLIVAYGSFLLADHVFHFSGVMASLAAGLVIRYRAEISVKLHNIENIEQAWGFFSFVANSFVFIMLGLTEVHLILFKGNIFDSIGVILISIPIVLVARALCIWLILPFYNMARRKSGRDPIPFSFQVVLFWGGLRGAVPVALVLAIPQDFPNRDTILHVTMANILFTLLVQGTTIKWLMDRFGIKPDESEFDDRIVKDARFSFPVAGLARLFLSRLQEAFATEGFLVREKEEADGTSYLMRKGTQLIGLRQDSKDLVLTSEERETEYINTVMQETLIELKTSVASIESVTDMENSNQTPHSSQHPPEKPNQVSSINILKIIQVNRIKVPLVAATKNSVLLEMIKLLEHDGTLRHPDSVMEDILEREASMNTGLGDGIAMPHAKTGYVKTPVVVIGLHPNGIDYGSADGKPVKLIVMVLSPKHDTGPHLEILSAMGKILGSEGINQAFLAAKNPNEVYRIIRIAAGTHHRSLI